MKVMCDDVTTIFVDGEQRNVDGTGKYDQLATLQIPASTAAIGIQCHNVLGEHGIMVQVEDLAGNELTVTDDTWRCSNKAQEGWSTAKFREDNTWQEPAYKSNVWDWKVSPSTKIIWTKNGADSTVYCRKVLPIPQPGKRFRALISGYRSSHNNILM